jgi:hypothetical protein
LRRRGNRCDVIKDHLKKGLEKEKKGLGKGEERVVERRRKGW